jgi:predicted nucleotidyltransferase
MDLVRELVERLKPLDPDKIILFGSYAYGEPDEESDVDLFIIKKGADPRELKLKAYKRVRDLTLTHHKAFDIFADTPANVKKRIDEVKDQFYQEVFERGKVIYAK